VCSSDLIRALGWRKCQPPSVATFNRVWRSESEGHPISATGIVCAVARNVGIAEGETTMKRGGTRPGRLPGAVGDAKLLGSLVDRLMARRGYAQSFASDGLQASLAAAVGPNLAGSVGIGNLKRGILHVHATNSVALQELTFAKRAVLQRLQQDHPDSGIRELKFHVTPSARS